MTLFWMSRHAKSVLPDCVQWHTMPPHYLSGVKQHINIIDRKTVLYTEMISEVTGRKLNTLKLFGPDQRPLEPIYGPRG